MIPVLSGTWHFTAAQTNLLILSATATQQIRVLAVECTAAGSNTVDVSVDSGFSSTGSLPAIVANSTTPRMGIIFTHGAIKPGGGAESSRPVLGAYGEDVLITIPGNPTNGDVRVSISYQLIEPTE